MHPQLPVPVLGRFSDKTLFTLPTNGEQCAARILRLRPGVFEQPTRNIRLSDIVLSSGGVVFNLDHATESYEQMCSLSYVLADFIKKSEETVSKARFLGVFVDAQLRTWKEAIFI